MNIFKIIAEIFDQIYASLTIPVFLIDDKKRFVKVNESFLAFTNTIPEDLQKQTIVSFFRVFKEEMSILKVLPKYHSTEIRLMDGKNVPVEANYIKLYDDRGKPCGALGFIIDLQELDILKKKTEELVFENNAFREQLGGKISKSALDSRKQLEIEVKEARAFLENVVEISGDGILFVGKDVKIISCNKSFAKMLGESQEEIIGKCVYEMGPLEGTFYSSTGDMITFDKEYQEYHVKKVEELHSLRDGGGGTIENWEYYMFNNKGEVVPFELTVSFKQDARGLITSGICNARNITERKKIEKKIDNAYQFKNRFFTNITHDFRTPLTLLLGPVEGILRGEFGEINPDIQEQLGITLRNSRQLLNLINQLLDFSRIEAEGRSAACKRCNLKHFISTVLDSFSFAVKKKHIEIVRIDNDEAQDVFIDTARTEMVLFNLIGNAVKFTPEHGTITVQTELLSAQDAGLVAPDSTNHTSATERCIKFSITDTGPGIRKEDLETIFNRFMRSSEGGSCAGGSGIGLAHARELVEIMGGSLKVTSRYGHGANFSCMLPVHTSAFDEAPDAAPSTSGDTFALTDAVFSDFMDEKQPVSQSITGSRPLVMIVDDNHDMCCYISGIISGRYDFITAHNGAEALKKLEQHVPDVILSDIMMPCMDGYEFMQQVKSHQNLVHIPFIFLTARADVEMKIEGIERGADDYIVKPFNSLELLARIKSHLRIRDLLQSNEEKENKILDLTIKLEGKYSYGNIIGTSPVMKKIYRLLESIKGSDATVLITGETGTGKELIANAIHFGSTRKHAPMISVNCGAIPGELMEREFFGHVKGAFTGATESRKGYFQQACGGTLFLDEIGELSRDMQVKLLRVLERGEILCVGDALPRKVDVRLVTATNKDLLSEVERGAFREDLYYRIHVIPVHVSPLRDRGEDIPLLIQHFLTALQNKLNKKPPRISEKEMKLFVNYGYPGNVRELQNIIERLYLLGGRVETLLRDRADKKDSNPVSFLTEDVLANEKPLKAAAQKAKSAAEREVILHILRQCDNSYDRAAKRLNICLASLYNKINESGLKK